MVKMRKENFLAALTIAIKERREVEKSMGYTGDSIFVAGLDEIRKQVKEQGSYVLVELEGDR